MTLRVRLQIVPFGDENRAYEIGRLDIDNVGAAEFGHHKYRVIEQAATTDAGNGWCHEQTILHRRAHGAWALVFKVLDLLDLEKP